MSKGVTLQIGSSDTEGTLTVNKESNFIGGYNNFLLYDGSVSVLNRSELRVCAVDPNASSKINYRAMLGINSNSTATLNVADGGKFYSAASQFITNFSDNTTVNISVEGNGSKLTIAEETVSTGQNFVADSGIWVKRENGVDGWFRSSGWYDKDSTGGEWVHNGHSKVIVYLGDSGTNTANSPKPKPRGEKNSPVNNCVTNISISNGGIADFRNSLTYIGSFLDREEGCTNKSVNFNIGEGSSISFNRLEVYADTNITNSGRFNVNGNMTLHTGTTLTLNLTKANMSTPVITLGKDADVLTRTTTDTGYSAGGITIHLNGTENMMAGTKFILFNDTSILSEENMANVTFTGTAAEVSSDGTNTIITLLEEVYLGHDPLADAVQAANWGVYKSSQAFTSLLWAPRSNAVVVKNIEKPTADGKGSIMTTEVEGRTLAWGSVYSSFSRNSSSGVFAGAEYSIVGGAIGVERQFACGSSIGAAFGYDWGKASPFTTSRVDQESWHAALYGRAAEWKLGQKSSVALDWSAAVGSTTSEHMALGSDWTQENIQLDARATYTYALTERTALSAFVGAQYYAQNDDSTERVEADSLQNLRLMVGGGISHKLTEKTTLFGEAMLFNDTMRHNPDVTLDDFEYGTGANPGRLGGSVTAGAQYQLTPDWTLRGSYSYEGADNSNEHRVNVGAVYSF